MSTPFVIAVGFLCTWLLVERFLPDKKGLIAKCIFGALALGAAYLLWHSLALPKDHHPWLPPASPRPIESYRVPSK